MRRAILHRTGLTKLSDMGGLARRMPVVAVAFVIGTASIAGIPPFNGYVSLSLIHTGLLDSHQYLPYALMLVAQAITIAALGKAAWLAFFRRRAEEYPPLEPLRPGMVAGLASLAGACCVVFGVLPRFFLSLGDGTGGRQPAESCPVCQRGAHRPGPAARAAPALRLRLARRTALGGWLRRRGRRARLGVSQST